MPDNRLIDAIKSGNLAEVKNLIQSGVEFDTLQFKIEYNSYTVLTWAAANDHIEIVELLLEKGANVNQARQDGKTALMLAILFGKIQIIELLLEKGANVNQADQYGDTALIEAAANGNIEIVKLLLEKGAKVNKANKDGETALMLAILFGKIQIIELLLEKGANVNQADQDGKTALMKAIICGQTQIFELLLKRDDVDVNHADRDGKTAFMLAIRSHQIQIIELLLKRNDVDVNQKIDCDGDTALMEAIRDDHIEIFELLLKRNDVNVAQANKDGDTALSLAIKKNNQPIVIALKKAIAQFITTIKKELDRIFNKSPLDLDALSALIKKINTLTDRQKDDRYKNERKEIRAHLVALIEAENKKLSNGMITGDLEAYLNCLTYIQNNLNMIKPNPKEKTAGKKIKLLILKVQSKIDEDKELGADSIASKIKSLILTNSDQLKDNLDLSDLVKPSTEKEIDELKSMVVRLTIDQRKLLRETLKALFDDAVKKPEENTWVKELQKNYDKSKNAGKSIPFIAILRVSESGNKPDHDTKIWGSVIKGIQWLQPSSKSKVSNTGFFSDKKRDETGQLSYPSLDKHKPGNNDL
jgi:ankyrin repeat protein